MKPVNKINKVMNNFNFKKVHAAMEAMQWEWWGEGVPTVKSLKQVALGLLNDAIDGLIDENVPRYRASTGGFSAYAYREGEEIFCYLTFEVAAEHSEHEIF